MSLWRLPPVVIIQLKRFQFTQHMRRKLRDFVVFPVEGLDLSRIMAVDDGVKPVSGVNEKSPAAEKIGKATEESAEATEEDSDDEVKFSDEKQSENGDDTAMSEESEESAASPLHSQDNGRTEMLYDLYGVVHHQGALSGGHYVASLKSELDGQWRLFNDAQVYEIHKKDVVDSSAYILFYIRRDVAKAKLSDFWDTSAREGEGLTEEDMDKLIRGRSDRCVIS
jgi:ubiquitin carboxyl-terminal hydrolase 6/32